MGLDSFASRTPVDVTLADEDRAAFEAAQIELCGGICRRRRGQESLPARSTTRWSSNSPNSLYQEWVTPEEVKLISRILDEHTPEELTEFWDGVEPYRVPHSAVEAGNLGRFFHLCAERGLGLIGWW